MHDLQKNSGEKRSLTVFAKKNSGQIQETKLMQN